MVIKAKSTGRRAENNKGLFDSRLRKGSPVQRGTAKSTSSGTVVGKTRYVSRQFD